MIAADSGSGSRPFRIISAIDQADRVNQDGKMPVVVGVNHKILIWARERAGYSLADVGRSLKKDVAVIESWENGAAAPSLAQLEKLAYQLYKRPLAVFFFPSPPEEDRPERAFRTLPQAEIESFSPDTLLALREAYTAQLSLRELTGDSNPAERNIFREIHATPGTSARVLASRVRAYLGVSIEEQSSWSTTEVAFKRWRDAVERVGGFVFKRAFKERGIDGFCLPDGAFPVIVINNKAHFTRQTFTLFHELAHALFSTGGITKSDDDLLQYLRGQSLAIETACNRFAHEILVPEDDFARRFSGGELDDEVIGELADRYGVSREVILRRLVDKGFVKSADYGRWAARWASGGRTTRGAGGNYYATKGVYLSKQFAEVAFSRFYSGALSIEDLAEHLHVKARNIPSLEAHLFGIRS
jgi:Zn-dependent peptidase ImmA (M78 family)